MAKLIISADQNEITYKKEKYMFVEEKDPFKLDCERCSIHGIHACITAPCASYLRTDLKTEYFKRVPAVIENSTKPIN